MIKEELYIDGQTIELIDSLNPNLTFNIADIAKPDTRKADFSKTITIPGSKKINKIFEHIFDINTSLQTFNPNLKTDIVYLVDGEVQIDGYLQLKKVNNIDGLISYECVIIGRLGNFVSALSDKELDDATMNWSTLNHNWTKSNQVASWSASSGYVYPMIDYASTLDLYEWGVIDLFPATYAKDYIDKMFAAAGYTYTSTFFTSDPFNKLIIPFSGKDFKLSSTSIGQRVFSATEAQFQATSSASQALITHRDTDDPSYDIKMISETDPNGVYDTTTGKYTCNQTGSYDFQFQVDLTGTFTPQAYSSGATPTNDVNCITAIEGKIFLLHTDSAGNAKGGYTYTPFGTTTPVETGVIGSKRFNITYTNTIPGGTTSVTTSGATYPDNDYFETIDNKRDVVLGGETYGTAIWSTSDPRQQSVQPNRYWVTAQSQFVESGDIIQIVIQSSLYGQEDNIFDIYYAGCSYSTGAQPFFVESGAFGSGDCTTKAYTGTVQLNVANGIFKNKVTNNTYVEGNSIDYNSVIPKNIKQKDFFMSIVKMFNLYIQTDEANKKNLLIEPREDFYNNTIVDWSKKLDYSQNIESLPMAKVDSKEYLYKFKDDKDYYNQLYLDTFNESYGQRKHEINNEFLNNTKKTEVIFSPTPIVGQLNQDRVIPTIKKYDENNGQAKTESNIRILYYGGLKATAQGWIHVEDKLSTTPSSTYKSTYPYAGHFNDPFTPTLDINFGLTKEVYYDDTFNTITFTNNNLFNKYHSKFIAEITDTNSKVINAYFHLTPSDIKNLSFKKQYYFNGSYFRLNKIENYNPSNPVTKCEFLKIKLATVFSPTTAVTNGGVATISDEDAPLYQGGMIEHSNNNIINNNMINALGSNNYIDATAKNITIIGSNNYVEAGSENVTITGNNNLIQGSKNVSILNTNNTIIANNNISFLNGVEQGPGATKEVSVNSKAVESISTFLIDTSGGNVTMTFATESTYGKTWTFKKVHSANQAILSAPTRLIDGATTYTLTSAFDTVQVQWDGVTYNIISTK